MNLKQDKICNNENDHYGINADQISTNKKEYEQIINKKMKMA